LNKGDSNDFEIIEEIEKPVLQERRDDVDFFNEKLDDQKSYSLDRKFPSNNSRNTSQNSNRYKKILNFFTPKNISPDHSNFVMNKNFTFNKSNEKDSQRANDNNCGYKEKNAVMNLISINKTNKDKNFMYSSLLNRTVKDKTFQKDSNTPGKKQDNQNNDKLVSSNNKRIEIKQENIIKEGYSIKGKKGLEKDYTSYKMSSIDTKNKNKIGVLNEKEGMNKVSPDKKNSLSKFFTENNNQKEKITKKSQDNKVEGNRVYIEPFKTTLRNRQFKNISIDLKGKKKEKSIELVKTQLNDKKIINLIDKNDFKSDRNGNAHSNIMKNNNIRIKNIDEKKGNKSLTSKKENFIQNERKKVITNLNIDKIKVIEEKSNEKHKNTIKTTSGQDTNLKFFDNNILFSKEDKNAYRINKKLFEKDQEKRQDELKEDLIQKHENTKLESNYKLECINVKNDEKDESIIEETIKDIHVKYFSNSDVRQDILAIHETNKHLNENIQETDSNNFITEKDYDYISKLDTNEKTNQEIMNENDLSHKFSEQLNKEEAESNLTFKKDVILPEVDFKILIKDNLNESYNKSEQGIESKLNEISKQTQLVKDKEVSTQNLKEECSDTKIKTENVYLSNSSSAAAIQNLKSASHKEEKEDFSLSQVKQMENIERNLDNIEGSLVSISLNVYENNEKTEIKSSDLNKPVNPSSNINEEGNIIDKNRDRREKLSRLDQQFNRLRASISTKKSTLNEENEIKPAENKIEIKSKIQGLQYHFMKQATINNTANIVSLLNDKSETLKTNIERSNPDGYQLEKENNIEEIMLNRPVRKNTVTKRKRPNFN
jgi:hypothetical protein